MLVSTQVILYAHAVPVSSAEYLPDWSDKSVPTAQVASQVNAQSIESLSQVNAEAKNFVQVWDGMAEAETEDDTPVLSLAQTENESQVEELCDDYKCQLNNAYT